MKVVISRKDGGVSIMTLAEQAADAYATAPEHIYTIVASELAQWSKEARAQVLAWRAMPDEAIPADRTFRNAWCDVTSGAVVGIDMPKARDIHRNRLRALRKPLLAALDVEYQRADEADDTAAKLSIAGRKQALRDLTADPAIEAATTADELKALMRLLLVK